MKIKIVNGRWGYADKVGKVFEAEVYIGLYICYTDGGNFYVNLCDAEVMEGPVEVVKSCDNCKYGIEDDDCKIYPLPCNGNDGWQPIENKCVEIKQATGATEAATHYQAGKQQPIEIMQQTMSAEQFTGFLLGNVIKYSLRLNHKGKMREDAGKCRQYAEWLCQDMDGKTIIPGAKHE